MFFVIYVHIYYSKVITHILHKIIKYHYNSITFYEYIFVCIVCHLMSINSDLVYIIIF